MSRDFAREELESLNLRLSLRIIRRRGRATGTTGTRTRPTTAWRSKATGDVPAHLVEFSLALASWCARLGRLQRLRTVKWATRPPSWRTNWRAPTISLKTQERNHLGELGSLRSGSEDLKRLRPTPGSWLLYSVGPDRQDDGARTNETYTESGDLIFPLAESTTGTHEGSPH